MNSRSSSARRPARRRSARKPPDPRSIAPTAYPVLIAYSDISAARRAMLHAQRMAQAARGPFELVPMLWRFDQLAKPRWREMALADAIKAQALTLALSDSEAFDEQVESWLVALLERTRGSVLRVLVLLGDEEAWALTLEQPTASVKLKPRLQEQAQPGTAPVSPRRRSRIAA